MPGEEESSEPKKIKLEIQNGAAIDPEAEVKPGSSIISSQGKMHTSMMTVVDLKQDKNSYYKLQARDSRPIRPALGPVSANSFRLSRTGLSVDPYSKQFKMPKEQNTFYFVHGDVLDLILLVEQKLKHFITVKIVLKNFTDFLKKKPIIVFLQNLMSKNLVIISHWMSVTTMKDQKLI